MSSQELQQNQSLGFQLSPQQLQFVKLLELNAPEFEEDVNRQLEANDALEREDAPKTIDENPDNTPTYLRRANNRSADDPTYDFAPAAEEESLYDYLDRQIDEQKLPQKVADTAKYIVGNLDSNGWLSRPLPALLNDLAFNAGIDIDIPTGQEALRIVQSLDPAGVGAENLRQCILLQLFRMPEGQTTDDAISIISDFWEPFTMHHPHKIISGLKISEQRLSDAADLIRSLNPKPGASFGGQRSTAAGIVTPDFIVSRDEYGDLYIGINSNIPDLRIAESYTESMKRLKEKKSDNKQAELIKKRYNEAKNYIELLQQRRNTLMKVITAIVDWQKDYFESGDVYALRPMMGKDIAAATGLDITVVSRATNGKYADTPWGSVIPLKMLFSDEKGDSATGETLTNRQIEAKIREIVDKENKRHPLSDEKIRLEMLALGYDLSRRTITKYRERIGIPRSGHRRSL